MAGYVRRIEPFEREHARPRASGDALAHDGDAALHIGNQCLGLFDGVRRASDDSDARKDGVKIVSIDGQDLRRYFGGDDLTLRNRTHVADPLGDNEVRSESPDPRDVDLIDRAEVP